MTAVWYLGASDARVVYGRDWAAAGADPGPTTRWDRTNGYSLPTAGFTASQLALLDGFPEFWTTAPDGPRTFPVPFDEVVTFAGLNRYLADPTKVPGLNKSTVGLAHVDDTADVAKPVSGPQAAVLAAKITAPTGGTAGQVVTANGDGTWGLSTPATGATVTPTPDDSVPSGTTYTVAGTAPVPSWADVKILLAAKLAKPPTAGAQGQVLQRDAGSATGTSWVTPASGGSGGGVTPAATATAQGTVRLAGALAGTADSPQLAARFPSAQTYGSSTTVPQVTRDAFGLITNVTEVAVAVTRYDDAITVLTDKVTALTSRVKTLEDKAGVTAPTGGTTTTPTGGGTTTPTGGGTTTPTDGGTTTTPTTGETTPATVTSTYTESGSDVTNPERGFFYYSETHYKQDSSGHVPLTTSNLQAARGNGRSTVFRYFVMEKYLTSGSTLDQAYLTLLAADLQACRDAGVKILPRFCYSTSGQQEQPVGDAPDVSTVTGHQGQIAAVLNQYKDVVHAVQCGLIGMWGEWYYTDLYGQKGTTTDQQWADRMTILNRWLSALDPSISVLVRYVGIKARRFGTTSSDPLAARVGFHNDGFLAPYDDYGTFSTFTNLSLADAQAYMARETISNPMNGESAAYNGDASLGPAAKAALAKYHWDLLNPEYNKTVLGSWSTAEYNEIARRLGYRFTLTSTTVPTLKPGGTGTVTFTLRNSGYAPIRHDKTMYVTLQAGTSYTRYPVNGSLAAVQPGYSATYSTTVTAPTAAGTYALHLELVDPNLPTRGEFAVRLGNNETTYSGTRNFFTNLPVTTSGGTSGATSSAQALATEAGATLTGEDSTSLTTETA